MDIVSKGELAVPASVPRIKNLSLVGADGSAGAQAERYAHLAACFRRHFPDQAGAARLRLYSSPGRTELCGNHTDHNHGTVLAASIQMDMAAAAAPRADSVVHIVSEGFGEFSLDIADAAVHPEEEGRSEALVRGIAEGIRKEAAKSGLSATLCGFSACIQSDVPPGSGLSSSASFEVLVGCILADCSNIALSPPQIAMIGQYAENTYFGKPCGLMDQMACALGNIAAIDFEKPQAPAIRLFRFDPENFGYSILIVNTGGSHADLTDNYRDIPAEMTAVARLFGKDVLRGLSVGDIVGKMPEIRQSCGDRAFLRAYHFITENQRPAELVRAMLDTDMEHYLSIVRESGESSWKYLQNLYPCESPREQGLGIALALTEDFIARKAGGRGACRVHGGGFAGTIQVYVPTEKIDDYRAEMQKLFGEGSVFPLRVRPYGVVCIDSID